MNLRTIKEDHNKIKNSESTTNSQLLIYIKNNIMKKIFIAFSMFALGFMTSCQQDELIHETSQTNTNFEITAILEDNTTSRTQLSPLEGNIYKVWWSEKAALSIFSSDDAHSK